MTMAVAMSRSTTVVIARPKGRPKMKLMAWKPSVKRRENAAALRAAPPGNLLLSMAQKTGIDAPETANEMNVPEPRFSAERDFDSDRNDARQPLK